MKTNITSCIIICIAIFGSSSNNAFAQTVTRSASVSYSDSVRSIDKDKITSDFLKALTMHTIEPDVTDSSIPLLSTQTSTVARRDWINLEYFPQAIMANTLNRQQLQQTLGNDCIGISFLSTKGNFVLAYIDSESRGHEMSTGWLVTYDYAGNRIDSLEFDRQFEGKGEDYLCDLSSRLNQDLTIQQTFIDWGTNNPEFVRLIGINKKGTRFDFEYKINPVGHFILTKRLYYKEKVYSDYDLSKCSDNKHPKGIHLGKETLIGDYRPSLEQSPKDKL